MVTGSIHASRCVTQPIYATVTDNYAHNSINSDKFPEFSRIKKFPEISIFSMFSRVVSTLSGREVRIPKLVQIFAYGKWLYPYRMQLHGTSGLDQRCLKMRNSHQKSLPHPQNQPKTPFGGPFNANLLYR